MLARNPDPHSNRTAWPAVAQRQVPDALDRKRLRSALNAGSLNRFGRSQGCSIGKPDLKILRAHLTPKLRHRLLGKLKLQPPIAFAPELGADGPRLSGQRLIELRQQRPAHVKIKSSSRRQRQDK